MSFWSTCRACLGNNRKIYPLIQMQSVLEELQFSELINIIGGICWECRSSIMKMKRFKNQVLEAQYILLHNSELKYLGRLSVVNKIDYDYKFNYDTHPPISDETNNEVHNIKNELDSCIDKFEADESDDGVPSCDDVKLGDEENGLLLEYRSVKVELDGKHSDEAVVEMTKRKFKKMRLKGAAEDDIRDKFTMVVFTENEMMRNREEKRRQPNFKKIPYKCESCVLGFTRKDTFDLHYEKKHASSIGPYVCSVCSTRFPSSRAMESHRQRHYRSYRCRLCKYETLLRGAAAAHCSSKHAADRSGRIHCEECGFVGGSPEDLAQHKRIQHTLSCDVCGEKFKEKRTLRTHKIRIHTSNRDLICDICGRTFKTKSRLETHVATHNATLAQKLSYCSVCNVQYKNIHVYRNHLKNSANHSERVYQCQDCDKRFASKVYWRKHRNFYHLKKSQFKCDICHKLLISEWRLKTHKQTRHGSHRSRDHSCDQCGKKFFTVSTLRTHRLTHSTLRSYMCEQCGDTFKQRAALHTHTRVLHAHTRTS